jgi:hypothetical protein
MGAPEARGKPPELSVRCVLEECPKWGALCSLLTNISGVQRMFKHKLEDLAPKKPPVRPKRVSR